MNIVVDDPNMLKTITQIAKIKNTTETKILKDAIEIGINEIGKPKKQESLKTISGLGTAPEPFNSVEELKKVENGE